MCCQWGRADGGESPDDLFLRTGNGEYVSYAPPLVLRPRFGYTGRRHDKIPHPDTGTPEVTVGLGYGGSGGGGGDDDDDDDGGGGGGGTQQTVTTAMAAEDELPGVEKVEENKGRTDGVDEAELDNLTDMEQAVLQAIREAREGNKVPLDAHYEADIDEGALQEAIEKYKQSEGIGGDLDLDADIEEAMGLVEEERETLLTPLNADEASDQFSQHEMHLDELERKIMAAESTPDPKSEVDDPSSEPFSVREEAIREMGAEATIVSEEGSKNIEVLSEGSEVKVYAFGDKSVSISGGDNTVKIMGEVDTLEQLEITGNNNTVTFADNVGDIDGNIRISGEGNTLEMAGVGSISGSIATSAPMGERQPPSLVESSFYGVFTSSRSVEIGEGGGNTVSMGDIETVNNVIANKPGDSISIGDVEEIGNGISADSGSSVSAGAVATIGRVSDYDGYHFAPSIRAEDGATVRVGDVESTKGLKASGGSEVEVGDIGNIGRSSGNRSLLVEDESHMAVGDVAPDNEVVVDGSSSLSMGTAEVSIGDSYNTEGIEWRVDGRMQVDELTGYADAYNAVEISGKADIGRLSNPHAGPNYERYGSSRQRTLEINVNSSGYAMIGEIGKGCKVNLRNGSEAKVDKIAEGGGLYVYEDAEGGTVGQLSGGGLLFLRSQATITEVNEGDISNQSGILTDLTSERGHPRSENGGGS